MTKNRSLIDLISPLRSRIQSIDEQIFRLIGERSCLVSEVGDIKKGLYSSDYLFIKPKREAQMLEKARLVGGAYHKNLNLYILRNLISASNCLEQEVKIGYLVPESLLKIREFYSFIPECILYDSAESLFQALESGLISIAVVPKLAFCLDFIGSPFCIFAEVGIFDEGDRFFCVGKVDLDFDDECMLVFFADVLPDFECRNIVGNYYEASLIDLPVKGNFRVLGRYYLHNFK